MSERDPEQEREEERRVSDIAATHWDGAPYTLALEIKRLLQASKDEGTSIDSGTGLLWPWRAPEPVAGHAEADLFVMLGGCEFYITVRKSNSQLLKEGVTRAQLGLDE